MRKLRKLIRHWIIRCRLSKLGATIRRIDRATKRAGWPNWKRKQLWRDFVKSSVFREAFIDSIGNVMKGADE